MWLFVIVGLIVCALLPGWLGLVPPWQARTLIKIHDGAVRIPRGQLRSHTREQVDHIVRDAGISSGFIAIMPEGRVKFSRQIPPSTRQRFRNVLLNQW